MLMGEGLLSDVILAKWGLAAVTQARPRRDAPARRPRPAPGATRTPPSHEAPSAASQPAPVRQGLRRPSRCLMRLRGGEAG